VVGKFGSCVYFYPIQGLTTPYKPLQRGELTNDIQGASPTTLTWFETSNFNIQYISASAEAAENFYRGLSGLMYLCESAPSPIGLG
jgi:hypothetical protein